jgi:hypothetical protein
MWYWYYGQVIGRYESILWHMVKTFDKLQTSDYAKRKYVGGILMLAYCMKCKAKREMKNAKAVKMKNGRPANKGVCLKCGTTVYRIGKA